VPMPAGPDRAHDGPVRPTTPGRCTRVGGPGGRAHHRHRRPRGVGPGKAHRAGQAAGPEPVGRHQERAHPFPEPATTTRYRGRSTRARPSRCGTPHRASAGNLRNEADIQIPAVPMSSTPSVSITLSKRSLLFCVQCASARVRKVSRPPQKFDWGVTMCPWFPQHGQHQLHRRDIPFLRTRTVRRSCMASSRSSVISSS